MCIRDRCGVFVGKPKWKVKWRFNRASSLGKPCRETIPVNFHYDSMPCKLILSAICIFHSFSFGLIFYDVTFSFTYIVGWEGPPFWWEYSACRAWFQNRHSGSRWHQTCPPNASRKPWDHSSPRPCAVGCQEKFRRVLMIFDFEIWYDLICMLP